MPFFSVCHSLFFFCSSYFTNSQGLKYTSISPHIPAAFGLSGYQVTQITWISQGGEGTSVH
jgi:hypothetical protein